MCCIPILACAGLDSFAKSDEIRKLLMIVNRPGEMGLRYCCLVYIVLG